MELVLFLVLCLTVVSGSGSSVEDDPLRILVEDYGYVQGTIEEGNEKSYDAWYGIPFAVPSLCEEEEEEIRESAEPLWIANVLIHGVLLRGGLNSHNAAHCRCTG